MLGSAAPAAFLARALSPPSAAAADAATRNLLELGALTPAPPPPGANPNRPPPTLLAAGAKVRLTLPLTLTLTLPLPLPLPLTLPLTLTLTLSLTRLPCRTVELAVDVLGLLRPAPRTRAVSTRGQRGAPVRL